MMPETEKMIQAINNQRTPIDEFTEHQQSDLTADEPDITKTDELELTLLKYFDIMKTLTDNCITLCSILDVFNDRLVDYMRKALIAQIIIIVVVVLICRW